MRKTIDIVQLLDRTGHLRRPFGKEQALATPVEQLRLKDPEVIAAIASYQDFLSVPLEQLAQKTHGRAAYHDGDIGPATRALFDLPRCGHPDYGPDVMAAVGSGSWKRCHDVGDFHCAIVKVDKRNMPAFLQPMFDEAFARAAAAYAQIGLKFIRDDNAANPNIDFSFVTSSDGWIGLAIVGQNQSCSSRIWCRYLATYRPQNILREWITLIMHELGHNAGLQHSRGGVMNPSIVVGLNGTWLGDVSHSILVRFYGGQPVPDGPEPGVEMWTHHGLRSNLGRILWTPFAVPILLPPELH